MISVALFMCPCFTEVKREYLAFSALIVGRGLFHKQGDSDLVAKRMIHGSSR